MTHQQKTSDHGFRKSLPRDRLGLRKIALTFVPFIEGLDAGMRERKAASRTPLVPFLRNVPGAAAGKAAHAVLLTLIWYLWRSRYPGGCAMTTLPWFADLPCKVGLSSYSQLPRCLLRSPCCLPDHIPTSSEILTPGTFVCLSLRFPIHK